MANHNLPTQSSTYVNFVTELDARFDDLCLGLDPARTTMTNLPTNSVGWSSAGNKWQRWTGSAWADLATTYAISISGNAATAAQLQTARTINGVSFNGSANITVNTAQSITFNNGGTGAASGTTFNGSTARTISYNSIGAPSTTGDGASGSWGISITGNAASASTATKVEATVGGTTSAELVRGNMADSDQFRILVGGSATDQGFAEIATADNGNEPIYVRQYSGAFATVTRTLTLLDSAGNTSIPGDLTTGGSIVASGSLTTDGSILASGNITAYSDISLKTDLVKITSALDKVGQLTGYTFTRVDTGERQTGLIAQEVQRVLPEAVVDGEHLSLAYGNLVGLLVEAIKELKAEVDLLKGAK